MSNRLSTRLVYRVYNIPSVSLCRIVMRSEELWKLEWNSIRYENLHIIHEERLLLSEKMLYIYRGSYCISNRQPIIIIWTAMCGCASLDLLYKQEPDDIFYGCKKLNYPTQVARFYTYVLPNETRKAYQNAMQKYFAINFGLTPASIIMVAFCGAIIR